MMIDMPAWLACVMVLGAIGWRCLPFAIVEVKAKRATRGVAS